MPSPVQFQETYSMDHLRQTGTARASDYSSENCVVVKELGVADAKVPKEFTAQGTTPSGKPRVFVCGMCTRAFARLEHLRRHERSHTKEKPFDCGVCQRKFSRRDLLLRHAQKLHAGCDDAVARMRRKSSKARTTSSASYDTDLASSSAPASKASSMTRSDALKRSPYHNSSAESQDSVNFNLNSFTGSPGQTQDSLKCTTASASKISRSNSVKDSSLKKQLFDKRKPRFRRASFSAQSGPNYAMVPPQQYDSSTAENVEFSTPQILPTFGSDDDTWLSNLCTIPGMSAYKTQPEINEQTQTYNFDHEFPKHTAMFGGGMHQDLMSSEGMLSTESSHINTPNSHTPHMSHRPSLILNSSSLQADSMYQVKSDLDRSGYSFYDIPDTYIKSTLPTSGVIRPLSPIRQEYEDELMDLDTSEQFLMKTMPGPSHMPTNLDFSHNQMHDLEEFNKCFETGGKSFMSGYSFYGDNPSIPSTGIESMSSHASTSPSNLQPSHVQPYQNSFLKDLSSHPENHVPLEAQLENTSIFEYGYSRSILFTSNLRQLIKKSLKKYPISDITSPSIPSNENMEFYKRTFVEKFLTYFPFLHASKLNEYEIMDMTSEEDLQNESARVCLPLLVATLGALLANNKSDSDQLYEASRRTVHIYLESRKKGDKQYPTNHQQQNSLWLIQSLTLSVIYGLFSDSENNIQIVIRQLNALNSLVKTSIKSNSEIIFTVSGQDQMIIEFAKESRWSAACKALRYTNDEEVKFKYAIIMQSQERSVLTIYQLTNFILMMFNVPLTLGVTELGSLKCPNIHDEFLWGFNDYNEFTTFGLGMEYQKSIDSLLFKDEANTIVFRDILRNLCSNKGEGHVTSKLKNLSRFGYNCVVRGLFELSQYEEYKYLNMVNVLQNVIKSGDSSLNNPHTRFMTTDRNLSQIVDYSLLVNFVKVCSIIDFRMVKEQSWLRNYDILTNNFHMFLTSMDSITDSEYLKVIDYCISITKVVMFRVSDLHNLPGINHRDTNNTSASKVLGGFDVPVTDFERVFGLQVEDEISCNTSPLYSQILFHIFVIFSIFAVSIAKRNSIRTNAADFHTGKEWQLNHKFISVLSCLSRFEDHMRVLFENHQLGVEMTNLFLLSSGNSREILLDNQGLGENQYDQTEIFAYSLDKALYILRVGEMMLRFLYEQNIKVIILKNLGGSISQIRKYLIDEESKILS